MTRRTRDNLVVEYKETLVRIQYVCRVVHSSLGAKRKSIGSIPIHNEFAYLSILLLTYPELRGSTVLGTVAPTWCWTEEQPLSKVGKILKYVVDYICEVVATARTVVLLSGVRALEIRVD